MHVYFFIFSFFEVNSACTISGTLNRTIRCSHNKIIGKSEKLDLEYKKPNDLAYLNFGIFSILP